MQINTRECKKKFLRNLGNYYQEFSAFLRIFREFFELFLYGIVRLMRVGINYSDLCSFCNNSLETLLHIFWECPQVKIFWNDVKKWLGNFLCFLTKSFFFPFSYVWVLWMTLQTFFFHHALLISRYHIFWEKSMHHLPSRELFIWNFLTCLDVKRRYSLKNGLLTKFNKKLGAFLAEQEN